MTLHAHDLATAPLYRLAAQTRRAGSLHQAIHTYQKLVREIDPWDLQALAQVSLEEAECLIALGQAYRLTGQPEEALVRFQQAYPFFADKPASPALGQLWNQQGLTHLLLEDYATAKEDFAQALTVYRAIGDPLLEAEVLQNLGQLCALDLHEIEQGIQYLETALALRRRQESTRTNAAAIVQILADMSSIKMLRNETIAEAFLLLGEAGRWVRLSLDPALAARISSLLETVTLLNR